MDGYRHRRYCTPSHEMLHDASEDNDGTCNSSILRPCYWQFFTSSIHSRPSINPSVLAVVVHPPTSKQLSNRTKCLRIEAVNRDFDCGSFGLWHFAIVTQVRSLTSSMVAIHKMQIGGVERPI
ncbi:hypothetical protein GOP47_0009525 [Adiantum capillus-veneris]|uniref:Uncharacterized protein n=1 Tax=Adiantum capillus-veneris TaxID=13818 RepID=A0A9D4UX11_ADICA|nr:hypothetical protein GOP47_0009525 [Adiantum capillus-veneris]